MSSTGTTYAILSKYIDVVKFVLTDSPGAKITEIAKRLCNRLDILDANDKPRISSCITALRNMKSKIGDFFSGNSTRNHREVLSPKVLEESPKLPENIPNNVEELNGLSILRVESEEQKILWNTVMQEHPKGITSFIGHQIKYLITCESGCLGGIVFSSSFMNVIPRDNWIGWQNDEKLQNLKYVIGMNRFLIRPGINCNGLSTTALGLALNKVSIDYENLYRIRPLIIETFVDPRFYTGACFEKAGFKYLGMTKGKGSDNSSKNKEKNKKKVFLYLLSDNFKKEMGLNDNEILTVRESLEGNWIRREFANSALGKKIAESLVALADEKNKDLSAHISNLCQGDKAKINRFYYFLNYKDTTVVNFVSILQVHTQNTIMRIRSYKVVYIVQDGCKFNYNGLIHTQGLGVIGKKSGGSESMGLHLHSSLAFGDDGVPLGFIFVSLFAPELRTEEEKKHRESLSQEEKNTQLWLDHYMAIADIAKLVPSTRFICLCDRECDFFNFFKLSLKLKEQYSNLFFVVRLKHSRTTTDNKKIFSAIDQTEPKETISLPICAISSRSKDQPGRKARSAEMEIRAESFNIKPPQNTKDEENISINVVSTREKNPPEGEKILKWYLGTNLPIETTDDLKYIAGLYPNRWPIEEQHKIIKSAGTKSEAICHRNAEAIKNELAIDLILSWHHHMLLKYSRSMPNDSANGILTNEEQHVLKTFAKDKELKTPNNLGDYSRIIGVLGGFLPGNYDNPGSEIFLKGLCKLRERTQSYMLEKKIILDKFTKNCFDICQLAKTKCEKFAEKGIEQSFEPVDMIKEIVISSLEISFDKIKNCLT